MGQLNQHLGDGLRKVEASVIMTFRSRGTPETAWTLPFRAQPVEKPHEIWRKMLCTHGTLVYDTHKSSILTAQNFKEDYEWQLA